MISFALCNIKTSSLSIPPAAFPPVNVKATQVIASAPVEVSWSPPSDGPAKLNISGYRIFYRGQDVLFLPATVTGIHLNLGQGLVIGQTLSIRTESSTSLLPSELIMATITGKNFLGSMLVLFIRITCQPLAAVTAAADNSGSRSDSAITIALGIAVFFMILLATVVVILICLMLRYVRV